MAMKAVFETYELLENILLHLPLKDLLFSQRVCKAWKELIAQSVRAQQALFLQPVSTDRLCYVRRTEATQYRKYHRYEWQTTEGLRRGSPPTVNPLFNRFVGDLSHRPARRTKPCSLHEGLVDSANRTELIGLINRPRFHALATWKHALLVQPPLAELRFACRNHIFHAADLKVLRSRWLEGGRNCPMWGDMDEDEYSYKKMGSTVNNFGEEITDGTYETGWMLEDWPMLQKLPQNTTAWEVLSHLKGHKTLEPIESEGSDWTNTDDEDEDDWIESDGTGGRQTEH